MRATRRAAARTLSSMTTLPEERRTEKLLIRPLPAMVIFKVVVNLAEPTILVGCSQRPKKRSWIIS